MHIRQVHLDAVLILIHRSGHALEKAGLAEGGDCGLVYRESTEGGVVGGKTGEGTFRQVVMVRRAKYEDSLADDWLRLVIKGRVAGE